MMKLPSLRLNPRSPLRPSRAECHCEKLIMTDLPDPIEHAAYYYDVNLKRLIAWFIDAVAITFIISLSAC